MANHGPAYGLTAEVNAEREARYSKDDEKDVRDWMESVLGEKLPGDDFQQALKNGVVLCNFLNKLQPGCCKQPKKAPAPFIQMENIGNYLAAVSKSFGVKAIDCFVTVDLYEAKNMLAVLQHFVRLKSQVLGQGSVAVRGRAAGGGSVFDRVEDNK